MTQLERLKSLDVFRGIAIASMILVNNPGNWDYIYPPLDHAEWNGYTPTDFERYAVYRLFVSAVPEPSLFTYFAPRRK